MADPTDSPKSKEPFGQGTAALRNAVENPTQNTYVEQMLMAYGGDAAVEDMLDWLKNAAPAQKWVCEVSYQTNDIVVYLDQFGATVLLRETPRGKLLPITHPVEKFMPDPSLEMLVTKDMLASEGKNAEDTGGGGDDES